MDEANRAWQANSIEANLQVHALRLRVGELRALLLARRLHRGQPPAQLGELGQQARVVLLRARRVLVGGRA